jgi:lysophospholipase L1-like esterase
MRIIFLLLLSFSTLAQSVVQNQRSLQNQIGTIFKETSFASSSNFPISGTGISRGTNKLDLTGNPTLFTSYVVYDNSSSAHRYTCIEKWKQRVRVKTSSALNGTSYGLGIGIQSTNTYDPYSTTIRWSWDNAGPGAQGSLYLYYKGTTGGQIQSKGSYLPTASTYYWIEIERNNKDFTFRLYSDALVPLFQETLSFNTTANYVQAHNTGQFTIHQFGGSANEVTNWEVSSSAEVGADYVVIGDSNTQGLFAATNANRWAERAMLQGGKTYVMAAGIADRTADVVNRLPEIIALKPKNVLLSIGRNDIAAGVSTGTWQANIDTIITTLEAAGITVKLCGVIASNFNVSAVQTYYTGKANTQVNFYAETVGVGTALDNAYDSGDDIHLNVAAQQVLATLVLTIL